jgi:adenylate kinase family enzyme
VAGVVRYCPLEHAPGVPQGDRFGLRSPGIKDGMEVMMQRVAVIGAGGAGKTTFALALGRRLGLPVVHLDTLYYGPGWEPLAPAEWELVQRRLAAEDRWVMDGNYAATLAIRLSAADTVVFLDLPPLLCVWRVICRWLRGRTRHPADLAPGLRHKASASFLAYVLTFRRRRRPLLLAQLHARPSGCDLVVLRSGRAANRYLALVDDGKSNQGIA